MLPRFLLPLSTLAQSTKGYRRICLYFYSDFKIKNEAAAQNLGKSLTDKRFVEAEYYKNIIEATASKVLSIDSTVASDMHPDSNKSQAHM